MVIAIIIIITTIIIIIIIIIDLKKQCFIIESCSICSDFSASQS